MNSMADHLAHAYLAVRQLGPCRPERENDPVRLCDRVRHLLGLIGGEIQHLDISCCDLLRMIMPHIFQTLAGTTSLFRVRGLATIYSIPTSFALGSFVSNNKHWMKGSGETTLQ